MVSFLAHFKIKTFKDVILKHLQETWWRLLSEKVKVCVTNIISVMCVYVTVISN